MKALVQRVTAASVEVEGRIAGNITNGLLIFLGVEKGDAISDLEYLCSKVLGFRIFSDNNGKMNLSIRDTGGAVLIVSQFTLSSDCRKGNRPSFDNAETSKKAEEFYELFIARLKDNGIPVQTGSFGKHMKVALENDGPVTFLINSRP
jgi:D-tyrosyl-tRNA(Tyr) deacylase